MAYFLFPVSFCLFSVFSAPIFSNQTKWDQSFKLFGVFTFHLLVYFLFYISKRKCSILYINGFAYDSDTGFNDCGKELLYRDKHVEAVILIKHKQSKNMMDASGLYIVERNPVISYNCFFDAECKRAS